MAEERGYGLRKDFVFPGCAYDIEGLIGKNPTVKLCVPHEEAGDAIACILEAYRRTAANSGAVHVDNSRRVMPVNVRLSMQRKDEKRLCC